MPSSSRKSGTRQTSVQALITQQAPGAVAVECGTTAITYGELNSRADALARRLIALGAQPGQVVGICLERSIEFVVAILGVLRSGAAYLPLDPAYPRDRLDFIVQNAGARLLVTTAALADVSREWPVTPVPIEGSGPGHVSADGPGVPAPGPSDLAYVIYTSGSTGRPKGVLVTHGNLSHSTAARLEYYRDPVDGYLLLSSFAFDSSVAGIFWTLCSGGRLVLPAPGEERDPALIRRAIARHRISHLLALPSLYRLLLDQGQTADLTSLRVVIVAGEACPVALAADHLRYSPGVKLFNEYGPTEATVWCTAHEITEPVTTVRVPIGRPIPGMHVYVVSETGALATGPEAGELLVGGPGVTSGYLNLPELTAERFVPDTYGTRDDGESRRQERLYRTGDLVRTLPDGSIDFLGRVDRQVKLRGYRIELGEIEAVIEQHPGIAGAAVVMRAQEADHHDLVAYLQVRSGTAPDVTAIRAFLVDRIPDYMVPAVFVIVSDFPRSANGKLDYDALPAPGRTRPNLQQSWVAPRSPLESWLADLWAETLGLDQVGIRDPFFELGGDSLQAARIVQRIQERLGEFVFVVLLFERPTVEGLATRLRQSYAASVAREFGGSMPAAEHSPSGITPAMVEAVRASIRTFERRTPGRTAPNTRAMFILAPPRSGTTLLTAMLAGHPGICAASELNLWGFETLAERRLAYEGPRSLWLEGTVRLLMELRGLGAAEATREMETLENAGCSVQAFVRQLQDEVAPRMLLDKSPAYVLDPGTLRHIEEDTDGALYVQLSRHPAGVIRSFADNHMEQVYLTQNPLAPRQAAEIVWLLAHRNTEDFLRGVPGERHIHIRYEDLVDDPEQAMRGLCAQLNLAFHPDLLQPYKDRERKILSGVHAESKSMGDPAFHVFDRITREPARSAVNMGLHGFSSDTLALARALGYSDQSSPTAGPPPPPPPSSSSQDQPPSRARQTRDALSHRLRQRRQTGTPRS